MDASNWIAAAAIVITVTLWALERHARTTERAKDSAAVAELQREQLILMQRLNADPATLPADFDFTVDLGDDRGTDPRRPRRLATLVIHNVGPGIAHLQDVAVLDAGNIKLDKGKLLDGRAQLRPDSIVRMNLNLPRQLSVLHLQVQWADGAGPHTDQRAVNIA